MCGTGWCLVVGGVCSVLMEGWQVWRFVFNSFECSGGTNDDAACRLVVLRLMDASWQADWRGSGRFCLPPECQAGFGRGLLLAG